VGWSRRPLDIGSVVVGQAGISRRRHPADFYAPLQECGGRGSLTSTILISITALKLIRGIAYVKEFGFWSIIVAEGIDSQVGVRRPEQHFGPRELMLAEMLITLSIAGQPMDVTFYHRKPILDVRVEERLGIAMISGTGARNLQELLSHVKFSDGTVASLDEICTINLMPKGGIPQVEIDAVDLAMAEKKVGPNGETMRHMIHETYHCKTRAEEDRFLRRFIASYQPDYTDLTLY
jgi:hypothetical protein